MLLGKKVGKVGKGGKGKKGWKGWIRGSEDQRINGGKVRRKKIKEKRKKEELKTPFFNCISVLFYVILTVWSDNVIRPAGFFPTG